MNTVENAIEMTNEQAVAILKEELDSRIDESNGNTNADVCNALKIAIRMLEKAKFHDLRKDPEDLPKIGMTIIYYFRDKTGQCNRLLSNSAYIYSSDSVNQLKVADDADFEYLGWQELEGLENI